MKRDSRQAFLGVVVDEGRASRLHHVEKRRGKKLPAIDHVDRAIRVDGEIRDFHRRRGRTH